MINIGWRHDNGAICTRGVCVCVCVCVRFDNDWRWWLRYRDLDFELDFIRPLNIVSVLDLHTCCLLKCMSVYWLH